jgi:putative copper export protein
VDSRSVEEQVLGWAFVVVAVHLIGATVVVGGQLWMTAASFGWRRRPADPGDRGLIERLERSYRRIAVSAVILTAATGLLYLRRTLISPALVATTPYGPLLLIKIGLTILLCGYLVFAPLEARGNPSARGRWLSAAASAAAIAVLVLALALRFV